MQTLTTEHLHRRIMESWGVDLPDDEPLAWFTKPIEYVIGGTILMGAEIILPTHSLFTMVLHNPVFGVTNDQLCEIMDTGNHCISKGSIVYENDYAYITWSNLGHI
jgi:hypothetical protein